MCTDHSAIYYHIYDSQFFFLIGEDPVELRNVDYLNF